MNFLKKVLFVYLIFGAISLFADQDKIDLDRLFKEQLDSQKHMLVFFHMNYCPYCTRMKNQTLQNEKIRKIIEKDFVFVHINIDEKASVILQNKSYSAKAFSQSLDIDFYPTTIFYTQEKELIYTARGYRSVEEFEKILQFIQTKAYEDIDFFEYK